MDFAAEEHTILNYSAEEQGDVDVEIERLLDTQRELILQVQAKNLSLFTAASDFLARREVPHSSSDAESAVVSSTTSRDVEDAENQLRISKASLTSRLEELLERVKSLEHENETLRLTTQSSDIASSSARGAVNLHGDEGELKRRDLKDRLNGVSAKLGKQRRRSIENQRRRSCC
jgi:hypothetical protein